MQIVIRKSEISPKFAVMKRIQSLDVLRGITLALMVLVNNPGKWGSQFAPLQHAAWNGCTPTDLVFPFFLFIMGVSAYFSLSRRLELSTRQTARHIVIRSAGIFAIGLAMNAISLLLSDSPDFQNLRIMGVLQTLALANFAGSIILLLTRNRHMLSWAFSLLAIYALLLLAGGGYSLGTDNIVARWDAAILGAGHMYGQKLADGSIMAFDPEGIISGIPRISHFLLGAFAGSLIKGRKQENAIMDIMLFGSALLVAGLLLQYGLPLNKKIWSPSFVLLSCGLASLILGLLMYLIDLRGHDKACGFFKVFGTNPLFLYCVAWILAITFKNIGFKAWAWDLLLPVFGAPWASLLWSLFMVALVWLAGAPLYMKKICIKL